MTRRTRKFLVIGATLTALTLAGGATALAADGDEAPRGQVRFVVTEHGDCPEKGSSAL
ncbi:hypothetical protein AB0L99_28330 [Streptomyces sp. NPDC051954]|uniref:hypothetical protein n=1 Tax=unclassified Streptomyces TaxID=2593676 RepID=UPI00343977A6